MCAFDHLMPLDAARFILDVDDLEAGRMFDTTKIR